MDLLPFINSLNVFFYFLVFLYGLVLGSFLNSWIWRTRDNCRIVSGRSVCVHCRRQLSWYENIPLFSFIFLKGRCRTCKRRIPWHYPAVELISALLLVFVFWQHVEKLSPAEFSEWRVLRDVLFLTILIITFVYDLLYQEVMVNVILAGTVIGLGINILPLHYSWVSTVLGMIVGGGIFFLQYLVSRGRWIGGGDIWIGVMMGAWLGWPKVLLAIFIAYLVGGVVSSFLLIAGKKRMKSPVPFGTFLAVATLVVIYYGGQIMQWYTGLLK